MSNVFRSWWPSPSPPPVGVLPASGAAGIAVALLLPGSGRAGLNLLLCAVAVTVPVAVLTGRRRDTGAWLLGAAAVALTAVAAVRASEWLAWFCAFAGACLMITVVLDARRVHAYVGSAPAFAVAAIRALPWASRAVPRLDRDSRSRGAWSAAGIGLAAGAVLALVVGALLASADAAFARVVEVFVPEVDLGLLPARVLLLTLTVAYVLAATFSARGSLAWGAGLPPGRSRPAVSWLIPVTLVGVVIAAFLAVQATMLFGGHEVVLRGSTISYAERARQGFGQLSVVTAIVIGLLAGAARRAAAGGPRQRTAFTVAGGALAVMCLLLVVSALRRLWLYQEAYGWTVARIVAGGIEIWIGSVLVGVSLAWVLRRTPLLPRAIVGSGAVALLALGLAGPDALAARWNVERFERTGKIDIRYVSFLSADAVPALNRLPEPYRSCALQYQQVPRDTWYRFNLARAAARDLLGDRPEPGCNRGSIRSS